MSLKRQQDVELFDGDDPMLPWETRIRNYARHDNLDLDLARHLAAIERGYKETEEAL